MLAMMGSAANQGSEVKYDVLYETESSIYPASSSPPWTKQELAGASEALVSSVLEAKGNITYSRMETSINQIDLFEFVVEFKYVSTNPNGRVTWDIYNGVRHLNLSYQASNRTFYLDYATVVATVDTNYFSDFNTISIQFSSQFGAKLLDNNRNQLGSTIPYANIGANTFKGKISLNANTYTDKIFYKKFGYVMNLL